MFAQREPNINIRILDPYIFGTILFFPFEPSGLCSFSYWRFSSSLRQYILLLNLFSAVFLKSCFPNVLAGSSGLFAGILAMLGASLIRNIGLNILLNPSKIILLKTYTITVLSRGADLKYLFQNRLAILLKSFAKAGGIILVKTLK